MSRLIPHSDMTAGEIIACSYNVISLLHMIDNAAWAIQNNSGPVDILADSIGASARLALELLRPVHDTLELHEGREGGSEAAAKMSVLMSLIGAYAEARKALDAADCDDDKSEFGALDAAERAIIKHSCATLDEVRLKVRFILENEGAYDTIRNCYTSGEETLLPFLRSLLGKGEAPC